MGSLGTATTPTGPRLWPYALASLTERTQRHRDQSSTEYKYPGEYDDPSRGVLKVVRAFCRR